MVATGKDLFLFSVCRIFNFLCGKITLSSWMALAKFKWPLRTSRCVSLDGVPNQVKSGINLSSIDEILSGEIPLLSELNVRAPEHFKAGGLHENMHVWEEITKEHPQREMILSWIRDGVDVIGFLVPIVVLLRVCVTIVIFQHLKFLRIMVHLVVLFGQL